MTTSSFVSSAGHFPSILFYSVPFCSISPVPNDFMPCFLTENKEIFRIFFFLSNFLGILIISYSRQFYHHFVKHGKYFFRVLFGIALNQQIILIICSLSKIVSFLPRLFLFLSRFHRFLHLVLYNFNYFKFWISCIFVLILN